MLDIRLIREKADFVRERLATRGGGDETRIDDVLKVDAERRKAETELQQLQAEHNRLSKEIGFMQAQKVPAALLAVKINQAAALIAESNAKEQQFLGDESAARQRGFL